MSNEIRYRASVVLVHNDKLLTIKVEDPFDKRELYFLPGGGIEPDETAPDAAARETLEETGFEVLLFTTTVKDIESNFYWNGKSRHTLTLAYWGKLASPMARPKEINDASYHRGVVWLPLSEIKDKFGLWPEIHQAIDQMIRENYGDY